MQILDTSALQMLMDGGIAHHTIEADTKFYFAFYRLDKPSFVSDYQYFTPPHSNTKQFKQ